MKRKVFLKSPFFSAVSPVIINQDTGGNISHTAPEIRDTGKNDSGILPDKMGNFLKKMAILS